jgi:flavin reductase
MSSQDRSLAMNGHSTQPVAPPWTADPARIPLDRQKYRNAMAKLAAAVNIVTSVGEAGPCGFTASAVCSVTDDPPTLLVCVNRASQSHPAISKTQILCVNTIASGQEELAAAFAGGVKDMAGRFDGGVWSTAITGAPLLDGAAAAFDCRVVDTAKIGTHEVFYCEVLAVRQGTDSGGLVYYDRKFQRLT